MRNLAFFEDFENLKKKTPVLSVPKLTLIKTNNADQFGYGKHGRAYRTQMGTLDTDSNFIPCSITQVLFNLISRLNDELNL